jgi:hypothetical protein
MAILEHFALKQLYLCDAASATEHTYSTQFQMYRCIISQLLQELEYRICLYIESSSVHVFPSTNKFFISYYPMQKLVGLLLKLVLVVNAGQ